MMNSNTGKESTLNTHKFEVSTSIKKVLLDNGSIIMFVILWILAALFVKKFATVNNTLLIIKQAAIPIIACLGMTLVLITGGIDLSLGYIIGFASIIVGIFVKTMGINPVWAIIFTIVIGAILGLFNGIITEIIKVPAFITTLGSGYIIYGVAQIISKGEVINRLPKPFIAVGQTEILGLPTTVYFSVLISLICYILLHKSIFGRSLSAFGYNARASHLSGIRTRLLNISVYVISGIMASIVGIFLTIRVNCAQPDMGGGTYTFEIVTAAILGGTSLFGGIGTIIGSIFGVIIMKMIENCINLLGVSYYLYQAFMGAIILCAIIFENLKNRAMV